MGKPFKPLSGMTFKTRTDDFGLFIETERGLYMLFTDDNKSYETYTLFHPSFLEPDCRSAGALSKIYEGMGESPHLALNQYISQNEKVVWEL